MNVQYNAWLSRKRKSSSESGLTLLECLVAIAVVGVSTAVIAPVMVFSVATRVQSQKAEQALQLAKLEVDTVRLEVERGDYITFLSAYPKTSETEEDIASTDAPTGSDSNFDALDLKVAKEVNTDDDTEPEFAVQVFRTVGISSGSVPTAFKMGVRVYDFAAMRNSTLLTESASLSFTAGEGQRGLRPLAVLYADVVKSDNAASLCDYRKYIDSTTSTDPADGIDCG